MPRMSLFRRYDDTWTLAPGLSVSVDQTQMFAEEDFPGMSLGPSVGREIGGCAEWEMVIERMAECCYVGIAPESATELLTEQAVIADPGEGGRGVQYVTGALILSAAGKVLRGAAAKEEAARGGRKKRTHRPQLLGRCGMFKERDRVGIRLAPENGLVEWFLNGEPLEARVGILPAARWRPCVQLCSRRDAVALRATSTFSGLPDPREWQLGARGEQEVLDGLAKGERLATNKMNAREWDLEANIPNWEAEYQAEVAASPVRSPGPGSPGLGGSPGFGSSPGLGRPSPLKKKEEVEDWDDDDGGGGAPAAAAPRGREPWR